MAQQLLIRVVEVFLLSLMFRGEAALLPEIGKSSHEELLGATSITV